MKSLDKKQMESLKVVMRAHKGSAAMGRSYMRLAQRMAMKTQLWGFKRPVRANEKELVGDGKMQQKLNRLKVQKTCSKGNIIC